MTEVATEPVAVGPKCPGQLFVTTGNNAVTLDCDQPAGHASEWCSIDQFRWKTRA